MEGAVNLDYQLSITFADLGHHDELPDRLLALLLERLPDAGPVLAHNQDTGHLTVMLAFASSEPMSDASRLTQALGGAMFDLGLKEPPTILDVHLAAADQGYQDAHAPGVLSLA